MRPLVFVAVLCALAGCSMPYEGTSFKALSKPERAAEGEKRGTNGEERFSPVGGDAIANDRGPAEAKDALDRTATVFPPTAQPGG